MIFGLVGHGLDNASTGLAPKILIRGGTYLLLSSVVLYGGQDELIGHSSLRFCSSNRAKEDTSTGVERPLSGLLAVHVSSTTSNGLSFRIATSLVLISSSATSESTLGKTPEPRSTEG